MRKNLIQFLLEENLDNEKNYTCSTNYKFKESSKYIKKVLEKIFQMKEMKLDYLKKNL